MPSGGAGRAPAGALVAGGARPRGRQPRLTPEVQRKIVNAISAGNYNVVAAQYAGIGESTFYRWLDEGEAASRGIKREFWEAVKEAESVAEVRSVALIESAAAMHWQAAAWFLERKHHERWGRRDRRELSGPDGGPIRSTREVDLSDLDSFMADPDVRDALKTLQRANLANQSG